MTNKIPYDEIDPGVREFVRELNDAGFVTFGSCQGGEGHAFDRPAVQIEATYGLSPTRKRLVELMRGKEIACTVSEIYLCQADRIMPESYLQVELWQKAEDLGKKWPTHGELWSKEVRKLIKEDYDALVKDRDGRRSNEENLRKKLDKLRAELFEARKFDHLKGHAARIKGLERWVNDLQSGMYINCVYCGHRYGPKDKVPAAMADVLKQHVEQCPKHPMSALKKRMEELEVSEKEMLDLANTNAMQCGLLLKNNERIKELEKQLTEAEQYKDDAVIVAGNLKAKSEQLEARIKVLEERIERLEARVKDLGEKIKKFADMFREDTHERDRMLDT